MKFRKKPVVIEATQWFKHGDHPAVGHNGSTKGVIQTLEGPMTVTPGDWIITGVKGEHYPCKPDIFEATYEAVSEPQERTTDYLEKCPNCNGPADNGFDRSWPDPNPYYCTKCMKAMEY